jgi:tetratricopeptide (TPR) repeat protein
MEPGTSSMRPIVRALITVLPCLVLAGEAAAQPDLSPDQHIPPWKRPLGGEAAAQVAKLEQQIDQLRRAGRFAEAIEPAREVTEIRTRLQGADHWQSADARRAMDDLRTIAALPEEGRKAMASVGEFEAKAGAARDRAQFAEAERLSRELLEIRRRWLGEKHPDTAESYNSVAMTLNAQGKFAAAQPLAERALEINRRLLTDDHPRTASSYDTLAESLFVQGKFAAAQSLSEKVLEVRRRLLGDVHPDTAGSYNNLASNLSGPGKYAEAEPFGRQALAVGLKALGEDHPDTARFYTNLGTILSAQGKFGEAEPLHRKGLAIRLKVLGEDHPDTARNFFDLALNLMGQGKHAEAVPHFRKALAIWLKTLGEDHHLTAFGYTYFAINLDDQDQHAEAEPLHRKGLAIRLKTMGEDHPLTALSYCCLAQNLDAQGKFAAAEPLHRKGLAIRLQSQGEDHPEVAESYTYLATNLDAQDKHGQAEPLHRKGLAIHLKTMGEDHHHTAIAYNNLALNLDAQGKLTQAIATGTAAAAIQEHIRGRRSASRLERALAEQSSPLPSLAVALARAGRPAEAWGRWEADLARGLLDDLSARALRPLTDDQRRRESDLVGQLQRLDERITRLAAQARRTQEQDTQLGALRDQQSALRGQWIEFQNALDQQYQVYAGKPSALEDVQKALALETALVGWLDVKSHHWACVLRRDGDPIWVKIPGSSQDGGWTKEEDQYPATLREDLAGHRPDWGRTAEALARQRLAPLWPHLKGVTHLIVLPSRALAGVPMEALVSALPAGSPRPVVSYAPSGSMFARLTEPRARPSGPPRLLALGDPAFPRPARTGPSPTPPDHGIAILAIVPNGTADLFGIRAGDVLLEYNRKVLKSQGDLAIVPGGDQAVSIPVKLWREGEVRALEIAAGPLGIESNADRPVAQVVLAQRAAAEVLRSGARTEGLAPLPGTRREVEAIAALFPSDQVTALLGSDATESKLQALAQSGALKEYRFLHLATHGQANRDVALSSAIFLGAEPDRPAAASADPAALELAPDGRITAEQIVRTWELDADLVVLSACESGLGRYAGGEGYLGFAQALFVKGARSLVLSQWKVDDKATALLMTRFYQDLLGRRAGLTGPLPKAEALDEAKRWLRGLTADEVGGELAALDRGPVRPLSKLDGPAPPGPSSPPGPTGVRPYAHPYYWASFLLIGDPR